jgi:hypothetical protein
LIATTAGRREPRPLPVAEAARVASSSDPRLACATSWTEACARWWRGDDVRLRQRAAAVLYASERELAAWHALRLDRAGLQRAHGHVVGTRLAAERHGGKRTVVTSELRRVPLEAHAGPWYAAFPAPDELPALLTQLAAELEALPEHAFVRAAWVAQTLGAIHPFRDANGGTARFLASLQLTRAALPPLVLSSAQRNGSFVDAVARADDGDLAPLGMLVHDAVQREVANVLLAGHGTPATWDATSEARADSWLARVDARWRAVLGSETDVDGAALPVLVRRGLRVPVRPAPRERRWVARRGPPVELAVAIAPVLGGDVPWTVVLVGAGLGELGPLGDTAGGSRCFVAPATEPARLVEARFAAWLDERLAVFRQGMAAWT